MSVKKTTEILSDPLKIQQMKLQALQIKEQKNKWFYIFSAFLLGFISNYLTTYLKPDQSQINEIQLLQTVNYQADAIRTLTIDNTNLKRTLKNLKKSSDN